MARLVRHERTGPYRIEPSEFPKDGKAILICGCGLTNRPPYCDSTHKACRDEPEGEMFVYVNGVRRPADEAPPA